MKKKIYLNAPLTLGFVAVCFVALLLQAITKNYSTRWLFSTYSSSLLNPLMYLRLLGHVFGHADWRHLLSNVAYLLLLGPILEEKYGAKKLSIIILVVAVVTGVIHNIFQPHILLLGSSGVCFAFILLASITGREEGVPVTLLLVAAMWIGQEVLGFSTNDGISHLTHIVGGISGAAMGLYFKKKVGI